MNVRLIVLCLSLFCGFSLVACGTVTPITTTSSMQPQSGPVGTVVTVFGHGLGGSNAAVKINGKSVGPGVSGDDQSIQFTIPAGATTGPITVNGVTAGTFTVT
jgi:hypothetical protein